MAEKNNSQRVLRTIAWAFSIVAVVAYAIGAIAIIGWVAWAASDLVSVGYSNTGDLIIAWVPVVIIMWGFLAAAIIFLVRNGKARKGTKSHIALGVLQIIFGSVVSGILMLCSGGTSAKSS